MAENKRLWHSGKVTFTTRKWRWIWGGGYDVLMFVDDKPTRIGWVRKESHAQILVAFLRAIPEEVHLLSDEDAPKVSLHHIDDTGQEHEQEDAPRTVH